MEYRTCAFWSFRLFFVRHCAGGPEAQEVQAYAPLWRDMEGKECEYHAPKHALLSLTLCGQVANDSLSLRQPVNISSLAFLSEGQGNHHHLATGNGLGSVRRYDTRASKQPVADWAGISRAGGIRRIEKGSRDQYVSCYVYIPVAI